MDYVRQRYGNAPIVVFYDTRGTFFNSVRRVSSYPAHAFFTKTGKRVFNLRGYPFPATPRSPSEVARSVGGSQAARAS